VRRSDWMPIALGLPGNAEDFAISEVLGWGVLPATTPVPDLPTPTPMPTGDLSGDARIVPDMPGGLIMSHIGGELDGRTLIMDRFGQRTDAGIYAQGATSADGTQTLFVVDGDIYLAESTGPHGPNLTNTSDRIESSPMWLDADSFICLSALVGEDLQQTLGYLTYVGFDGTYEVLIPEGPLGRMPAVSPDGRTVAVAGRPDAEGLWLLDITTREWQRITLPEISKGEPRVDEITWSPDGRTLGLAMSGYFGEAEGSGVGQLGVGTYNLDTGELTLLGNYSVLGRGGGVTGAPQWSPDRSWLIFQTMIAEDPAERGLWLVDSAGTRRIADGPGAISPDGQWVASTNADGDIVLFRAGEWTPIVWELPGNAYVLKWINYIGP
jgi:hypothetical protein